MPALTDPYPGVHEAVYTPRRLITPAELHARAKLELFHQPLYSAMALGQSLAIPASTTLFTYARGATVPGSGTGAVTSNEFHTNMETPGILAAPKVQIVTAMSVVLNNLAATAPPTLADPSFVDGAVSDNDLIEDLLNVTYGTSMYFRVGGKSYIRHATTFTPGNTGIGGLAAVGLAQPTAATPQTQRVLAPYTVGPPFSFPVYPVLIASQQSFSVEVRVQNTVANMNDAHWLHVFLEGVHGREVQ